MNPPERSPNYPKEIWIVNNHKFKAPTHILAEPHTCKECGLDYWEHKWNNHTVRIWHTAIVFGLILGATAIIVLVVLIHAYVI